MSREPARERYDAVVDLFPPKTVENFAYALVKQTYRVADGRVVLGPPEPLRHDLRDPEREPKMPPGSDFWLTKTATDVVVLGSSYARAGHPVAERRVAVQVGRVDKRIQVWGQRYVVWRNGRPVFTQPELFEEMAIVKENAYGGCDLRVPVDPPKGLKDEIDQAFDHPGLYPRNPFGKGYVVDPTPVDGVALPNLEDPDDPLTPDRFVVRDPTRWWQQPLPWTLDWHHPLMFPRFTYLGADAWFPGPDDATMAEVRRRLLPPGYRREIIAAFDYGRAPPSAFYQEASLGMSFTDLAPGTPITVSGMHPEGKTLTIPVPPPPQVEILIEGSSEQVKPNLSTVVVEPAEERMSFTWVARRASMPRAFIPGVHGKIPLVLRVDRDAPIAYETPPTMRSRLDAAGVTSKGKTT